LSFGQCGVSSVRPEQCCHTRSFLRSRDLTFSLTWYRCNSRLRSAILYTLLRSHNAFLLSEALSKECTHQPPLQIWKQMPTIHEIRAHNKARGAHDVTFFFNFTYLLFYSTCERHFTFFYNYTFFWLSSFAQPQSKCVLFCVLSRDCPLRFCTMRFLYHLMRQCTHYLHWWRSGHASASRTEDPGFESRQGVRFLGLYTLQCCCQNLNALS
jgi:hypothetical protein